MGCKNRLFVLTHSAGFRHSYLTTAVEVLAKLGGETGIFETYATEECFEFNDEMLRACAAVLFMTTGELPMSEEQKSSLIRFVENGGGFIGVHNATDTFYKFPEYGRMLGGYFNGHPWTQEVYAIVEDGAHPSTRHLPKRFKVLEEVYTFRDWSREKTHVLIRLDNSSVDLSKGTRPDNDYALAWCHKYGQGRVFYTAFGHFTQLWRTDYFQKHILGGIAWAMGEEERV